MSTLDTLDAEALITAVTAATEFPAFDSGASDRTRKATGAQIKLFSNTGGVISPTTVQFSNDIVYALIVGYTGTRNAFLTKLDIRGAAAANATYTSGTFLLSANSNLGGTSGVYTNYKGGVFGLNPNVFLLSGSTNIISAVGQEIDVSIASGANVANKFGMSLVLGSLDRNRGDYDDAGISYGIQSGATTTWQYGISFGQYAGGWPFAADSSLIAVQTRQAGGSSSPTALFGIDFTLLTIAAGGAPIAAALQTPASSAATGKTGSICWDAGFIYICTATNTWKRAALATF